MNGKDLVTDYIDHKDWQVFENANIQFSAQGLNMYLSGILVKDYWLKEVYPEIVANGHRDGAIHIHNLKSGLTPYCSGWDLADLLISGFGGASKIVSSAPPKHLSTALMQLVNFLYSIQGEVSGAVAISNWDTLLSPFIWADKLDYRQVKQEVQEFIYHMNVPTRAGFQTVFSNITLDILPTEKLAEKPAIVGGVPQDVTYGELKEEREMLIEALFDVLLSGDSAGRPFTFPIITIDINHDFPYDADFLRGLWELTAKYGLPNFANYVTTGRNRDEIRSMCCRLQLDNRRILRKGGVFSSHPLSGSIGVISLNMPHIALENGENFIREVQRWCELSILGLRAKREFIEKMTERGLYPLARYWLRGVKELTGKYWAQHFSTIGLVGMHEACLNLGIKGGITSTEGHSLAIKTLQAMREVIDSPEFESDLVNLEATPAEGASHRLAVKDIAKFGSRANHSGPREAPYYTGSTLYPNSGDGNLFDQIEHQEPLQALYTGGTVFHFWVGEKIPAEGAKVFVRKVMEKTTLPYITITPIFSICPTHGYISGEINTCPTCGQATEVYTRVVGYLRSKDAFNKGKRAEAEERKYVQGQGWPTAI
ncbi:MAG: ribonucleoside triphosphate reductase [Bdellovibrionaceae bacterium]|nr:ribonucleoside triphosphate reductase [Pseudobdellovibrionaceae bacterium]